jgi:hypothetical protein
MDESGGRDAAEDGGPPVAWQSPDPATEPPTPQRPVTATRRILEAAAWIVGILGLLFFGRVFAVLTGSRTLTPREMGEILGTILGAVLVGVFVRWLLVRIRHGGRVLSPWILVVAIAVLLIGLVQQGGARISTTSTIPIGSYVKIDPPYAMEVATPEEEEQIKGSLGATGANGYEFRRLLEGEELVGRFLIADLNADASAEFRRGIEQGWEANAGAEAHESVVGGRQVIVGTAPNAAQVIWVEPPFALTVYAADVELAQRLAASIMAAYEP